MEKDKTDKLESRPDGWNRFERAVDAAVESGPPHQKASTANDDKRRRAKAGLRQVK